MPMKYQQTTIPQDRIPAATDPVFQHLLDTYAGEINKIASIWLQFSGADLTYRPHPRSSTVEEIFRHELLSQRRFFGEFLSCPEPPAAEVVPDEWSSRNCVERLAQRAVKRLDFLSGRGRDWWLTEVPFFDVERQRIWIFWRRILHSAHHRTQLSVYLRLMDRKVSPIYGPTADVSWEGADPTQSAEAAERS